MAVKFKTYEEAEKAGFTRATKQNATDVSGGRSFGYAFENKSGQTSVEVYFSEEKNRMGGHGCVVPMFPS